MKCTGYVQIVLLNRKGSVSTSIKFWMHQLVGGDPGDFGQDHQHEGTCRSFEEVSLHIILFKRRGVSKENCQHFRFIPINCVSYHQTNLQGHN